MYFCTQTQCQPIPTSENTLLLFVAKLAMQQLLHTPIKVYLSTVCNLHITSENHHHFTRQCTLHFQIVLNGIKREQATTKSTKVRCPITSELMLQINTILSQQPHYYNNFMIWVACCPAFLGFLRVSEFTIPTQTTYDSTQHLSLCDIALDSIADNHLICCESG